MSNHNKAKEVIRRFSGQDRIMTIPFAYIDLCDDRIEDALLLNQIVYWSDKSKHKYGWFYKTYDEWYKEVRLSPYKIKEACKRFKAKGFLETKVAKTGGSPTMHYNLDMDRLIELLAENTQASDEPVENLSDKSITTNDDKSTSSKNFDEEFEQIWELYPNKKGKARAKKSYVRDRKSGASKEEVKQGVVDYAQHIKILKREPQFIQHGSTFFNNQAWADDWTAPGGVTTRASVPVADVNHYAGSEIDEALKELLEEYGVPITQGMTEETAMRALAEAME